MVLDYGFEVFRPANPAYGSRSIGNLDHIADYFEAQCKTIATLITELGHRHIDLLRIDIEGAEHEALANFVKERIFLAYSVSNLMHGAVPEDHRCHSHAPARRLPPERLRCSQANGLRSVTCYNLRMADPSITVYTPESPLRHPGLLLSGMFRDLLASRGLAWRLFVRDISAQYRQTLLGYVWAFIPPLVASLPFVFLNSQGIVAIKQTPIPYPAYAMIGTIIWQVFVDALSTPLKTVTAAKTMLARINFPREAILMSAVGQVVFSFLVRLVLLAAVFIWFRITPPVTAFLFPVGIFGLMLIGFMLGILLTPLGLLYSDVQQTIPVFAMFLMFLTPVLYPPPEGGIGAVFAQWNPLSPLVVVTRNWLTTGSFAHLDAFIAVTCAAVVLTFVGWLIYRVALPHIISRIGN